MHCILKFENDSSIEPSHCYCKFYIITHKKYSLRKKINRHFYDRDKSGSSTLSHLMQKRLSITTLQLRHNEYDGISNHQRFDCLLNRLFRHRENKISKPRVTGLCEGNSPVTGEFPAQRASAVENVSGWWRHHDKYSFPAPALTIVCIYRISDRNLLSVPPTYINKRANC